MRIWRPSVKEDIMSTTRRPGPARSFDLVAGNGLINRRALLGKSIAKMPKRDNFILPYRDRI